MASLFEQPLAFVDLETTGANAQRDRITEIGVVEWDGEAISEWSTLVNPQTSIPSFIVSLTGITDAMVADAPTFAELAENLLERLQGRVFFAHNARFDYGFLKNEFKRAGLMFRARTVCTVKLSRRLFPEEYKHNLDVVVARMGLGDAGERHRALTDARLIQRFLARLRETIDAGSLTAALDDLSRQPALPPGVDADALDDMPDGHGVYLFFAGNDLPLYVGKSNRLRRRVLSHFSGDHQSAKEMQISQQVQRVSWIGTAGELGAHLLEARLIKERQPSANHRLRRNEDVCTWRYTPNADGSAKPELVLVKDVDFSLERDLFGLYRSPREATNALRRLAEDTSLCQVVLGLERAPRRAGTPCFGMQVGKCRGACVGKEAKLMHQARFITLLSRYKLMPWPFPGAIAIREHDENSTASDWHLVKHWVWLGTAHAEDELPELLAAHPDRHFDMDEYKLLSKALKTLAAADILRLDAY